MAVIYTSSWERSKFGRMFNQDTSFCVNSKLKVKEGVYHVNEKNYGYSLLT